MLDNEPPVEVAMEAPNPFADSIPFPEAGGADADYDKAEEVSLEQLLAEGRSRPETFHGTVAVPIIEEVEELGTEQLVGESPAVALMEEPAFAEEQQPAPASDSRTEALEAQVASLRASLQSVLHDLDDLRKRVREALETSRK